MRSRDKRLRRRCRIERRDAERQRVQTALQEALEAAFPPLGHESGCPLRNCPLPYASCACMRESRLTTA